MEEDNVPHPLRAYRNQAFIDSSAARPLRIMAEYLEPEERFAKFDIRDTIVFFGSARTPSREDAEAALMATRAEKGNIAHAERMLEMSAYYEAARELAFRLTNWSKSLPEKGARFVICTGGGPGIMEAANRGASEARGINIGLNISLPFEQHENPYITRGLAFEFHYFFMRKFWFSYLAKAMVVMPGGFGTLDEFVEVVTLIQTLKMKKKVPVVLFGSKYWEKVLNFQTMVDYGTISPNDLSLFHRTDSIDDAFDFVTRELLAHAMDIPGPRL